MYFSSHKKSLPAGRQGFTLIELMVVIAIIGVLASIVTVSLVSARAKGRDAKRIADIKTIQLALETYYNDNSSYPLTIGALVGTYLPSQPKDPKDNLYGYSYAAFNNANNGAGGTLCNGGSVNPAPTGYHLGAALEDNTNSALLQDRDLPVRADANVCGTGSNKDFDGLASTVTTPWGCGLTAGGLGSKDICYDVSN